MLNIDGSKKSGSGTILRLSIALSAILGEPLHIYNIRKKRTEPGLKPQHLEAVLTAGRLCDANIKGASIGSQEIWFEPGCIEGGKIRAEIGTAGSIPMLIMTVLPICAYAEKPVELNVLRGGTDVRNSPVTNYLAHVLLPILRRMNIVASIEIRRYGYYPKGMGEVTLRVQPCENILPVRLEEFGKIKTIEGISVCTFLKERKVAERQAAEAEKIMRLRGFEAKIEVLNDFSNRLQKGSSIALWGETTTQAILGGDAIGELGKPSEIVAQEAAGKLVKEIDSKATADMHMADILIPYIALARGESAYLSRSVTDHLETNVWLAAEILGVEFRIGKSNDLFRVSKG